MAITDTAPYAPGGPTTSLLDTYRETGFGGRAITTDLLVKTGIGESIAPRVVQTLRLLNLVDDKGTPTEAMVAFKQASSATYRDVLAEVVREAYEPVFSIIGMDVASKTDTQIEDAFRSYRPDSLRPRMVSLFLALCRYSGIVPEESATKPRPENGSKPKVVRRTPLARQSPRDGRKGEKLSDAASQNSIFNITDADLGQLSQDEFDAVWTALGTLARSRARARLAAQADADDKGDSP